MPHPKRRSFRLLFLVAVPAALAAAVAACGSGGSGGGSADNPTDGGTADGTQGSSGGSGSSGASSGSGASGSSGGASSGSTSSGAGGSSGSTSSGGSGSSSGSSGSSDAGSSGDGSAGSCSVATVGQYGSFKGYRMFPADNAINKAIDTLSVNSNSTSWLSHCSAGAPHLQIDLSMPYQIVAGNTPTVTATSLTYNSKPYPNPWPFPTNALIESGDMHCLAFDVGNCKLYEVYNFVWGSGKTTFTGGSGTVWDTTIDDTGNGSGSDAAGLPIIPLIIRYDELITAGAINHALRMTCASTEAGHIAPARASASSSAGSGVPANPNDTTYPPMGMRVRLKASYDPTAHGFATSTVALLKALQKYGLLLADNGSSHSPMYITGSADPQLQSALSSSQSELTQILATDLEVVDTGPVTQD
jgi:hypothetical protein